MATLPRFLIHAETYDKLPKTVLSAIQDETRTSLYGARLLLEVYAMGVQDQLVELGKLVAGDEDGREDQGSKITGVTGIRLGGKEGDR